MPCQGPCARSSMLALVLLTLATGVQLAPPGIQSAPSGDLTAAGASNVAPPVSSVDVTTSTTTPKSIPAANVNAAPVPNDLFDQQKLDFLAVCLANSVNKPDVLLCNLYRNLTTALVARKQKEPITAKTVQEMLADPLDNSGGTEKFCENLSPVLMALREKATSGAEQLQFKAKPLENEAVCANLCLPIDEVEFHPTLKPICRVLLWGFRQLLLPEPAVGETAEVQAAEKVVVPPLIDQGVKLEKVAEPKADVVTKPVAAKPVQQTSAATTAHVTPSTSNSAPAAVDKPQNVESGAKAPAAVEEATKVDENGDEKTEDEDPPAFLDPEGKNQQNLDDMKEEGGPKENLDTGDDEQQYEGGDSDEDPPMETNIATAAGPVAAGSAPKEMAVRGQQPEPLPRLDKDDVQRQELPVDPFFEETDSNFFSYFLLVMFACIVCYVAYHNKSKLLALALEGRRSSTGRGGFSKGGRKHTAAYRKLDSNLEEAIMSNSAASSRSQQQIIY